MLRPHRLEHSSRRSAVRASDTLTRSFARYKLVTYSFIRSQQSRCQSACLSVFSIYDVFLADRTNGTVHCCVRLSSVT